MSLNCFSAQDSDMKTGSREVFAISISSLNEQRRDVESQSIDSKGKVGHSFWWKLGIDLPLLLVVGMTVGLFELGVIPSHKAGFYCNDPALSHKFTGDTVSMVAIMLTVILIPLVIIIITEFIFLDESYLKRSRFYQAILNTIWLYRVYKYGFFFNICVVEVMKVITGNPRPTFFDICEPDTAKNCTGSEFVPTFKCTSTRFSQWFQSDSSHSFPSGHTSLSVYCALFLAWYLQRRAFNWTHRSIFLVPFIQLTLLTYAVLCSLTRITDHRHHWWDVLVGSVIGVVSALYVVLALCDNDIFSYTRSKNGEINSEESHHQNAYDRRRHIP